MSRMSKENLITKGDGFNRTQKKLIIQRKKESDGMWLIFHLKIEQTMKRAAIKVVNEKLLLKSYIQRTYNIKMLQDSH